MSEAMLAQVHPALALVQTVTREDMAYECGCGRYGVRVRMLRISEAVKRMIDNSARTEMALTEIPALMLVMCFVSHVFACCWFALSVYGSSDTGRAWVTSSLPGTDVHYTEVPMAHQYFTAYHWALSQMTSGAMGLQAENTHERAFNILVLIVGVVLSSTISPRCTAKLAEYSPLKSKQRHTVNTWSNYLRKVGVDHKLVVSISLQVRERLRSLEESSFDPTLALEILPLRTQALLYYEIGRMNLCHPLFRRWSIIDGETVGSMSFKQFVSFQISGKSDTVFQAASDAETAHVVVIGLVNIHGHERPQWFQLPSPWMLRNNSPGCKKAQPRVASMLDSDHEKHQIVGAFCAE